MLRLVVAKNKPMFFKINKNNNSNFAALFILFGECFFFNKYLTKHSALTFLNCNRSFLQNN